MNDYDFIVEGTYEGNWAFPMSKDSVYGTLIIEKESMVLRILIKNSIQWKWKETLNINGRAFKQKKNEKQKTYEFDFLLHDLRILKHTNSGTTFHELIFDVREAYMSINPNIDFSSINNCIIRTELLDKWCWEHIKESFIHTSKSAGYEQNLEYKQKEHYTCFEDKKSKVLLYFGTQTIYPSVNGFHIINKCFLNINFNKKTKFDDAYIFNERVCYLFSLLWGVAYEPEYVEFRTDSNKFIYINRREAKYLNRFEKIGLEPFTELTDFNSKQLNKVFNKWLKLFDKKHEALVLYSETILNDRLSPKNIIKNLLSVIDGLTEEAKTEGKSKSPKRERTINTLLGKCSQLTKTEKNIIKTGFLRETGSELKPRFKELLLEIKGYPPYEYIKNNLVEKNKEITEDKQKDEIIFDFADSIVDTRNYLTHPKNHSGNIIPTEKYSEYAYLLKKILQAYLMQKINVPKKVIHQSTQIFL